MHGRREFLAALGAAGAAGLSHLRGGYGAQARGRFGVQAAPGAGDRIDTHHHVFPQPYVAALAQAGRADGIAKSWSVERTLEDMDRAGVRTAILSVTQPATTFAEPAVARRVARESNEWVAKLIRDMPGRFGLFALVPMPNVDDTLKEIEYALDTLKADGVGFMTSYGDRWLGHQSFAPVMDELNRRRAVVYTHPTTAPCCGGLLPSIPDTVVEFGTDTSRTITDIVFSGTAARCEDARFIFSHGGGTVPFLMERFTRLPVQNAAMKARVPNGVMHELTRFYYDTAWVAHPPALAALTKFVPVSQILLGSDYPYRTGEDHVRGLADYGFSDADGRAIGRENALRLLPRLRG